MSRVRIPIGLAVLVGMAATANRSPAQPPAPPVGPVTQPKFSPYLNLLRQNGTNPAVNYFGIVRPQVQMANQIQALNTQTGPTDAGAGGPDQPVVTGNPFGFQNYRQFFQNQFSAGPYPAGGLGPSRTPIGSQFVPQPTAPTPSGRRR